GMCSFLYYTHLLLFRHSYRMSYGNRSPVIDWSVGPLILLFDFVAETTSRRYNARHLLLLR
ncbi:MAG TPA: hypothetical protein PLQ56_26425, partial [Aggregatilineales bacterium]|nr:hypothetical protein [Aggregatilineales bacterium]